MHGAGSDAGLAHAIVVAELGGFVHEDASTDAPPEATLAVDPFVRYATVTDDAGAFELRVPAGSVGLHTFKDGFLEDRRAIVAPSSPDAAPTPTLVTLNVPSAEAGSPLVDGGVVRPTATRLAIASEALVPVPVIVTAPSVPVTFSVAVAPGASTDPLSGDIFLVQLDTEWAGAFAAPTPAIPGRAYPPGVYSRNIAAPSLPGVYTYSVVVASESGVVAARASVALTVTPNGTVPLPDASVDAPFYVEGGGLADGRR